MGTKPESDDYIKTAARLLGVQEAKLIDAITKKKIRIVEDLIPLRE